MAPNKLATLIVATAVCLFSYVSPIFAQTWHASRPIRVIVPFAPGGSNDFIARLLAPRLQSVLGQPVVVENKSGAGGAIGAQAVAHADPDGHTILFHSSTLVIQPLLMTTGYDALKDFTPVSLISEAPLVFAVHPSFPGKTFADFLNYARAKGADVLYGSAGVGSTQHLAGELFNGMAGTKMKHVPYRGNSPADTALMAGDIQVVFDIVVLARQYGESGRYLPLAVTSKTRSPSMPDLPTIDESGVPNFELTFWQAASLPKNTPIAIVQEWEAAIKKVLKDQEVQTRFREQGYEARGSTSDQLADFMQREAAKWAKVIADANIHIDH